MPLPMMAYAHVDVFATRPYTGNSLAVFVDPPQLDTEQMMSITQELRHFETIFVRTTDEQDVVRAKVFDLVDELDFAGHPLLGAAAVLHENASIELGEERAWTFVLNTKTVHVTTCNDAEGHVRAVLDQGRPQFVRPSSDLDMAAEAIAAALGLDADDLDDKLPLEIISTGLRYLVVPVRDQDALARARIVHPYFGGFLHGFGAQFVYVLDAHAPEGRHWNNDGVLEDVATGSAAGCVAAYLLRHGLARDGQEIRLAQGRHTGRPSSIAITAHGDPDEPQRVTVGGGVCLVGTGLLHAMPPGELW
ncbi:PhzF family phenazine biosynthesis protein [Nonomuraea sp. NPDC046802]|uniref:PhzF family phenazine biosynthesis protein n=1 Tax=Nonomuraea sp. NPDC046802 TaxID=3154919 RepID=UPI0033FFD76D